MCGIAGVLYKQNGSDTLRRLGLDLITMLDGCQHRGPDSTGFALYTEPAGADRLRLRFFVGTGDEATETVAGIRDKLASFGAEILEEEAVGSTHRFTVRFEGDLQSFAYAMEHVAKVVSIGSSLDIVKDVGGAHDVDDVYHVAECGGTHGIGHVRLATESDVSAASGPVPTRKRKRSRSCPAGSV